MGCSSIHYFSIDILSTPSPSPSPPPTNFVVTNKSAKFFSLTQGGLTYQLSTYN